MAINARVGAISSYALCLAGVKADKVLVGAAIKLGINPRIKRITFGFNGAFPATMCDFRHGASGLEFLAELYAPPMWQVSGERLSSSTL
jgi:hypothetical protein